MVALDFEVDVQGAFEEVWKYFMDFSTISEWDPNVKTCKVLLKMPDVIGTSYEIVSSFNGKESTIVYETERYEVTEDRGSIFLFGKNARITAQDEIIVIKKGPKLTKVIYRADICLRGLLCFMTPCIKGPLGQLAISTRDGVVKKGTEKWGKAKAIK